MNIDYDIPDPVAHVVAAPIDTAKAAKMIESGALTWIGDNTNFPEVLCSRKSDDIYSVINNNETFDQILGIRMLAQAIYANDVDESDEIASVVSIPAPAATAAGASASAARVNAGPGAGAGAGIAPPDIRSKPDKDRDLRHNSTFHNSTSTAPTSPLEAIETGLCRAAMALGSKALRLRTAHVVRHTHLDETTEVKVRDPKDPKSFINYIKYGDSVAATDRVTEVARMHRNPIPVTIESVRHDVRFIIGIEIAAAGFDTSASLREVWLAVDNADAALREAVKKAKPDDAKAAKAAAKKAEDEAKRKQDLTVIARAISASASPQQRAAAASGSTDDTAAASTSDTATGKVGRPKPGAGGPTKTRVPDRATVLALPAEKRTAAMVRRWNLCHKCRQDGHRAAACTNDAIKTTT
jgi:hypothetical protein